MARSNSFDVNKDYYSILGVSKSVTIQELRNLMDTSGSSFTDEQNEAYSVLTNSRLRKDYDKARDGRSNSNNGRQRVVRSQNGVQQAKNGRGILKGVALTVLIAGILASTITGFIHADKYNLFTGGKGGKGDNGIFEDPYISQEYEESTDKETSGDKVEVEVAYGEVKNYGDATNENQVAKRVEEIQEQLIDLGIININTGAPYTDAEITKLLKYINGAYIPANEAEAYTLVNMVLDFTCAVISNETSLNMIQYQANSDVITKDIVAKDIKDHDPFDFRLFLMGNTYCGPALDYFQNTYHGLMSTTDRAEFKGLYDGGMQTLANMTFGNGQVINGVNYTIESFEGSQQQPASVILWMYGMTLQTYDVEGSKQTYYVDYDQAGEDIAVDAIHVKEQFNVLCDPEELAIEDNGLVSLPNETNFAQNRQIQLINAGLENLYHGNTDAYQNNYQYTITNRK